MRREDDETTTLVEHSVLETTYSNIDRLRAALPETALQMLARDVIARLSKSVQSVPEHGQHIIALTEALVSPDSSAAAAMIDGFHRDGADIKSIHLEYLAPAAMMLGDWWKSDRLHFSDVTVGTGRIYAIIRSLARRYPAPIVMNERHALFAQIPGEDHTLGIRMAAELTRKEGWDVELIMGRSHDELVDIVSRSNHLIIGLSGGGEHALTELARLVLSIQISQPTARLLVAGNIAAQDREALQLMQVDAIESEFEPALIALERFWNELTADQQ